jgi:hypothetical protein
MKYNGPCRTVTGDSENRAQHNVPGSLRMTQKRAKFFFLTLKSDYGEKPPETSYTDSKGWFKRFKKRCNLHNIKNTVEAASADSVGTIRFVLYLRNQTEEGGDSQKQAFSADETGSIGNGCYRGSALRKKKKSPLVLRLQRID